MTRHVNKIPWLIVCLLYTTLSHAKVIIFTYAYNQPTFIEMQDKTFKKFLLDNYEFIVFNDATNTEIRIAIEKTCEDLHITCINIPQEIHDRPYLNRVLGPWYISEYNAPSVRNCNVVQYSLDILGFHHNNILVLLESDVFLIKPFSFTQYMQHYDLAGYNRSVEYTNSKKDIDFIWIGLIYINMETLLNKYALNINCGHVKNTIVDSGGYAHYYLQTHPQTRLQFFDKLRIENYICNDCQANKSYKCNHNTQMLQELGFCNKTIKFIQETPIDWGSKSDKPNSGIDRRNIEFLNNNHFVHFYGASGYAKVSLTCDIEQFYKDKTKAFIDYIHDITR